MRFNIDIAVISWEWLVQLMCMVRFLCKLLPTIIQQQIFWLIKKRKKKNKVKVAGRLRMSVKYICNKWSTTDWKIVKLSIFHNTINHWISLHVWKKESKWRRPSAWVLLLFIWQLKWSEVKWSEEKNPVPFLVKLTKEVEVRKSFFLIRLGKTNQW